MSGRYILNDETGGKPVVVESPTRAGVATVEEAQQSAPVTLSLRLNIAATPTEPMEARPSKSRFNKNERG